MNLDAIIETAKSGRIGEAEQLLIPLVDQLADPGMICSVGVAFWRSGFPQLAVIAYRRAYAINPNPIYQFDMAVALWDGDDRNGSQAAFEEFLMGSSSKAAVRSSLKYLAEDGKEELVRIAEEHIKNWHKTHKVEAPKFPALKPLYMRASSGVPMFEAHPNAARGLIVRLYSDLELGRASLPTCPRWDGELIEVDDPYDFLLSHFKAGLFGALLDDKYLLNSSGDFATYPQTVRLRTETQVLYLQPDDTWEVESEPYRLHRIRSQELFDSFTTKIWEENCLYGPQRYEAYGLFAEEHGHGLVRGTHLREAQVAYGMIFTDERQIALYNEKFPSMGSRWEVQAIRPVTNWKNLIKDSAKRSIDLIVVNVADHRIRQALIPMSENLDTIYSLFGTYQLRTGKGWLEIGPRLRPGPCPRRYGTYEEQMSCFGQPGMGLIDVGGEVTSGAEAPEGISGGWDPFGDPDFPFEGGWE